MLRRFLLGRAPAALSRGSVAPLLSSRFLCTSKPWDAASAVHGTPEKPGFEQDKSYEQFAKEKNHRGGPSARQFRSVMGTEGRGGRASSGYNRPSGGVAALSGQERADLMQFQVYVHQRLAELSKRLPPKHGTREQAELAFLEEEVVMDQLPRKKRRIRDPLADVPIPDLKHTNLPLLNRFVSEAGAVLPRRLTGVAPLKQRRLTRAIKRAQVLALMPKTWKLPRYRHSSYADQNSLPERPPPPRSDDDEFRDPPDIRFPNQWEKKGAVLDRDLSSLVRSSLKLPPRE